MALAARVTLRGLLSPVQCLRCRVAVALPLTRALSGAAAGAGAAPESALAKETRDAQAMAASSFDPSLINGAETPLKINALADSIVALNLVETMQLGEALKKRLGLPAGPMMLAPLGSMVPGAAGGGGAPAPGSAAGAPAAAGGADAPAAGAAAAAPAAAAKEEKSTVRVSFGVRGEGDTGGPLPPHQPPSTTGGLAPRVLQA